MNNRDDTTISVGGQAVIEGVMMRREDKFAIAVRKPSGEIATSRLDFTSYFRRAPRLKVAVLRGSVALAETMAVGIKAISLSAAQSTEGEVEITKKDITVAMVVAVIFAVGLFFVLPTLLARLVDAYISSTILYNLTEGAIRILILIGYIWVISNLKDVRRIFQYHGAEHKVINSYEDGKVPSMENVKQNSTLHLRCGTNFLLVVMVVSVFVFALLGRPPLYLRIISRILVIPLVAGISYEIIRFSGRHHKSKFLRILMYPGLLLQKLTTREPSNDQIEVALAAFNKVMTDETA
ncbi:MAG: DUF1385 domain-containing protein [Actinobacteria bacterium]|nr:DUF1385 domain-containing protein [Actinomycetota bacterium]